jgi:hypothetical protein
VATVNDTGFILATGSREAPQWLREELRKRLFELSEDARRNHGVRKLVVVHGAARGVDRTAKFWAETPRLWPVTDLPFEATWEADCDPLRCQPGHRRKGTNGHEYCPAQGVFRNGRMVDYVAQQYHEHGAWVKVAAFYRAANSFGTQDCVSQARAKGLDVLEYGDVPQSKPKKSG